MESIYQMLKRPQTHRKNSILRWISANRMIPVEQRGDLHDVLSRDDLLPGEARSAQHHCDTGRGSP